jgi:exodeoxyribonuclease VII small subunit
VLSGAAEIEGPQMAKSPTPKTVEGLTYEAAFSELQEIVTALEAEPSSLDQAMALFERGQALAKRCTQLLDQAELKVKRLSGTDVVDLEED